MNENLSKFIYDSVVKILFGLSLGLFICLPFGLLNELGLTYIPSLSLFEGGFIGLLGFLIHQDFEKYMRKQKSKDDT